MEAKSQPAASPAIAGPCLIQLPNGNWVDPRYIISIRAVGPDPMLNREPSVVVEGGFPDSRCTAIYESISCATPQEAATIRDKIAEQVQSAAAPPPAPVEYVVDCNQSADQIAKRIQSALAKAIQSEPNQVAGPAT